MKIKEYISSLFSKLEKHLTTAFGNHNDHNDEYGSRLITIDNMNFYLDHVKYTVEEDNLIVSGYNPKGFNGVATIAPQVTYRGYSYDVLKIGVKAFEGCTGLTSITIPNSVTTILWRAFEGCTGLTSVHISNLTAWCNIHFDSNPLLNAQHLYLNGAEIKELIIPNNVTSIGEYAFEGCTGLTSITIHQNVTSIGRSAFRGCTGLTSINIPNSVTSIGKDALAGCTGLTSINIPNSVTSIGNDALAGCTGLTSINIPNSVTFLGGFSGCTGLTSINIPNSVIYLGGFSGCTGLTSIECLSATPPFACPKFYSDILIRSSFFSDETYKKATLYVPQGSLAAYKSAEEWSKFANIVEK